MKRDIQALSKDSYDLLIVGGGIQGACVALEAARYGIKVALVERSDFGGATSANSLKILHGGLRYLQHFDFPRMIASIRSRKFFAGFAPHLIRPLPCVIPTETWSIKNPLAMWIALKLNDLIAFDRNQGLTEAVKLPNGGLLSRRQCRDLFPLVAEPFATGGARWYDYLILNSERLTLECLNEAVRHGACVANYIEVEDYLIEAGSVVGIRAKDRETGQSLEVRANTILNTVGPWWNKSLTSIPEGNTSPLRFAKAINLILRKSLLKDHAVGLEYRDPENANEKRFFFMVPWQNGTMIGTTYRPVESGDPTSLIVEEPEIASIMKAVQSWFPDVRLSPDDVAFAHTGLLPIELEQRKKGEGYHLHEDTLIVSHEKTHGLSNFYSIKTVKYTTSPVVAEKFVKLLLGKMGRRCIDAAELPDTGSADAATDLEKNDPEWLEQLRERYGARNQRILEIIRDHPDAHGVVCPVKPSTIAEIQYFVREEMALRLEDIVFRRGAVSGTRPPTYSCLKRIADIAAKELAWDGARTLEEIQSVVAIYRSRGVVLEEN